MSEIMLRLLAALCVFTVAAGDGRNAGFLRHRLAASNKEMRGAALDGTRLLVWGPALAERTLPGGAWRVLAKGDFREGGCLTDLDRDGIAGLVAQEGPGLGDLVWRKPPDFALRRIDSQIEMHDCIGATLFGRRGLLMVQRYGQVRFYEPPAKGEAGRWPYREIYSFYTASRQGGLLLADVDGDNLADILSGKTGFAARNRSTSRGDYSPSTPTTSHPAPLPPGPLCCVCETTLGARRSPGAHASRQAKPVRAPFRSVSTLEGVPP